MEVLIEAPSSERIQRRKADGIVVGRTWSMQGAMVRAQVTADRLHDVAFATIGSAIGPRLQAGEMVIHTQHPEGWPHALTAGQLDARLDPSVLLTK